MLVTQPETSVLVIGPTRSGKTAGLVIPNLLEWEGPAIATSTKSELVELTAGYRQSTVESNRTKSLCLILTPPRPPQ